MTLKLKHGKRVAGIYLITRIGTNKHYVGSSANIRKRVTAHKWRLNHGNHHSPPLQRAWLKYGASAFTTSIVQEIKLTADTAALAASLIEAEQFWFALYARAAGKPPAYNVVPLAGTTLGRKASLQTRLNIRLGHANRSSKEKALTSAKLSVLQTGRKHTPEHNEKVAASKRGKKVSPAALAKQIGRKQTPEHIAKRIVKKHSPGTISKMSAAKKGKVFSAEHRANLKLAAIGRVVSPDTITKAASANRGKSHTTEHKEKISAALTGRKRPPEVIAKISATKRRNAVGKEPTKQSAETIAKRVASNTGKKRTPKTCANISKANLGKKRTAEARANMSAAHIGKKQSNSTIAKRTATKRRNADLKKLAQSESAASAAEKIQE
jgi:group I intron endonuclease